MAIGDGDRSSRCIKRTRGSGGCSDDHDAESSRNERCRVAAADFADDDGAGDYIDGGDSDFYDEDEDDDCLGEDYDDAIYDDSDDAGAYLEEKEETKADSAADPAKQRYIVLTEDLILARQAADTAAVAEVLQIPAGFVAVLLRRFNWSPDRVQDAWFSDDRRARDAVGMPAADGAHLVPMALSRRRLVCGICFGKFYAGRARSAGCSHFYCDECWRGYVGAAVGDGARCLALRCPDPACAAAVVGDLVDAVAADGDRARYARFALRSYVEESGGRVKWCPGADCALAVELLAGGGRGERADVFCECGHGFCWACGEEAHRPVSCGTVRAWLAKNASDSETANWVLTHTKLCPGCRRPIEKNQGCNHMTCRCGHRFCWLCSDPLDRHRSCFRYDYGRGVQREADDGDDVAQGKMSREEERRRREAKASLDRYLYHYERWASSRASLRQALADIDELRRSGLARMAAALEVDAAGLAFLTEAYELIADGRRVMRWVYAYGYFLDPQRDAAKRALFDHLQGDANSWLERLHGCAELERAPLCGDGDGEGGGSGAAMNETYRAYKKKLEDLTKATRGYFANIVKAFETDLPEFNSIHK